ncbi:PilW family protein [Shewanella sp.]|uniref:PilW family protein n=1 Tax=Shewanella sp. TaxID=50422 RepID=UPI003A985B83
MTKITMTKGFSLIELMVAMLISLFLTLGLFAMFSMSATNIITTGQFNQLQENGRLALAIITPDLMQTGFMGDATGQSLRLGTGVEVRDAIANDCIGAGINNRSLPTSAGNFRLLWGYENGNSAESIGCLSSVEANTDVVQIKRMVGPAAASSGYRAATKGDNIVFFSNEANKPTDIEYRTWQYQHRIYYISDVNGEPVLTRRALSSSGMNNIEQLVEGVENMRILYGIDMNGDDVADKFLAANDVAETMWNNSSTNRVVAFKVFFLVRAVDADRSYQNDKTYTLGDKQLGPFNDNYRRIVLSTMVVLENPLAQLEDS